MKIHVRGFNTAAQDSNMGSLSQESELLPLSHSTPQDHNVVTTIYTDTVDNLCTHYSTQFI